MASYVAAYRVGMLVSGAGALFLVTAFQNIGFALRGAWNGSYAVMAALVLVGVATTLAAAEPKKSVAAEHEHGWSGALQRLVPEVQIDDLTHGEAGIRAQALSPSGELLQDFEFARQPNALHVLNAPSPAATASLAIADEVIDRGIEDLAGVGLTNDRLP